MRSRLLCLQNQLTKLCIIRKYASKKPAAVFCDAHMNELPVPCGPWDKWYKDKQNRNNKILMLGAFWWAFSFGMAIYTESIYLNWSPPLLPGPPSDMVEECVD